MAKIVAAIGEFIAETNLHLKKVENYELETNKMRIFLRRNTAYQFSRSADGQRLFCVIKILNMLSSKLNSNLIEN